MTQYFVDLSTAQDAALSMVATAQQDWITAVVHERCRIAIEEIVGITVQQCLDNGVQLPGTKDAIVALAFERGWVKSAADRQTEADDQIV